MNDRRKYRFEFLDALRGVAILAVMLVHLCGNGRESGDELVHRWIWPIVRHGYLGVQLFFVLSGYCILAAIYGTQEKDKPIRHFMTRRFHRIFPPYWWSVVLLVVLAFGTILISRKQWTSIFPMTLMDWMLNLVLLQGPFQAPDANLVYWSLSVEIQFYVLAAACLWNMRWAEAYLLIVSAASTIFLWMQFSLVGSVFAYWPEFACGIAAFYWITGEHRWRATPWLLVAMVILAGAAAGYRSGWAIMEGWHYSLPVKLLFCMLIMVVLLGTYRIDSKLCQRGLSRGLAWLGAISYSLYLIHVPLATRVFNLGARLTTLRGLWWLVYAITSFLVILLFGTQFYKYCERPWMNRRKNIMRVS